MITSNNKLKPRLTVVVTKYSKTTPTAHIYQKDPNDPPYSSTESTASVVSSVTEFVEKSASELGVLLKGAYRSLKEKEKNLVLAAEIGQSLLEHNQALTSDYNRLLETMRSCEIQASPSSEIAYDDNSLRSASAKKSYESIIEMLEQKNADIQESLEKTQEQAHINNQLYSQRQRKLETEIEVLRTNLVIATQKVQDLEDCNQTQQERVKQRDTKRVEKRRREDAAVLEELTIKMEELLIENKHLYMSKKSVEEKLLRSLADLEHLSQELESFELTQKNYEMLLEAFEAQKVHIRELNDSLEDHRLILSRWRDKGTWSPRYASSGSEHAPLALSANKPTLLGELEKAHKNSLTRRQSDSDLPRKPFHNPPVDSTFLSNQQNRDLPNEAEYLLSLPNNHNIEQYDLFDPESNNVYAQINLYPTCIPLIQQKDIIMLEKPKKGLINLIQFQTQYLFHSLLRWCRLATILTAAVFINMWKGPKLLKQT